MHLVLGSAWGFCPLKLVCSFVLKATFAIALVSVALNTTTTLNTKHKKEIDTKMKTICIIRFLFLFFAFNHLFADSWSMYRSEYEMLYLRPIKLCSTPLLNQITGGRGLDSWVTCHHLLARLAFC